MAPTGYVVLQHAVRLARPVVAYERWMERIPDVDRTSLLGEPADATVRVSGDPHCLDLVKDRRSLLPMAQEARKPMFLLRAADGALDAHAGAAVDAYRAFERLARRIAEGTGVEVPS